jgi:rhodanese-related sulfurtransferase
MAPLYPDLLSNELNILSGLLIGIAFGYVLEQAGFSSSRRLAGLFYGTDFTVLRVFFTAAITAMAGVILLGAAGLLDLEFIYINPTFLGPAIVGGVIMGAGFILGGYCPGTSICAAAIGKKDALAFVVGGLLGVFLYGEAYPLVSSFVNSGARGPIKVFDSLGVSRGAFALFLVVAAIGAFAATSWVEKKANPTAAPSRFFPRRTHRLAAAGAVALGFVLLVVPGRRQRLMAEAADPQYQKAHPVPAMTADELAFRLIDRDPHLLVVDIRGAQDHARLALPASINVPIEGLFGKEWAPLLGRRHTTRVFVDEDGSRAPQAALLAELLGYDDVRVLEGGVSLLRRSILDYRPGDAPAGSDLARFRGEARELLAQRIAEAKGHGIKPKKIIKKIQGGC